MRALLLILIPFVSSAQLTGNISLSGDMHTGNYTSYGCTITADVKHDTGKFHYYVSPSFRYTEKTPLYSSHLVVYERETYINSGISYYSDPCNKLFLFSEFENSVLRKIAERASLGAGYGKYANFKYFKVSLSEVILPEFYQSEVYGYAHTSVRSSTRLKIETKVGIFNISSTTLFQPSIVTVPYVQWSDNICARSTNIVCINLTDHLMLGVNYTVTYDSYSHLIFEGTKTPITSDQSSTTAFIKYKFP